MYVSLTTIDFQLTVAGNTSSIKLTATSNRQYSLYLMYLSTFN